MASALRSGRQPAAGGDRVSLEDLWTRSLPWFIAARDFYVSLALSVGGGPVLSIEAGSGPVAEVMERAGLSVHRACAEAPIRSTANARYRLALAPLGALGRIGTASGLREGFTRLRSALDTGGRLVFDITGATWPTAPAKGVMKLVRQEQGADGSGNLVWIGGVDNELGGRVEVKVCEERIDPCGVVHQTRYRTLALGCPGDDEVRTMLFESGFAPLDAGGELEGLGLEWPASAATLWFARAV